MVNMTFKLYLIYILTKKLEIERALSEFFNVLYYIYEIHESTVNINKLCNNFTSGNFVYIYFPVVL